MNIKHYNGIGLAKKKGIMIKKGLMLSSTKNCSVNLKRVVLRNPSQDKAAFADSTSTQIHDNILNKYGNHPLPQGFTSVTGLSSSSPRKAVST